MAGKHTSLASLAGAKVEDVPGRSDVVLLSLPLDRLHCTRFNPRRNFGTDDELRDFGEKLKKEQLQPAVVVSRAGYLKLWPGEADNVGSCPYVIANGERRYRASKLVGRGVLEVVHREDVAASRATFLDAVQSENNDRQDLDPIERAIAIETMVTELGGADQVAVYYGKTKGWVSQQRKLLRLTPALQDLVSSGEMPVRVGRDIAGLPADVQAEAWQEELGRRKAAKEAADRWKNDRAAAQTAGPAAEDTAARFTAVNQRASEPPAPPSEPSVLSSGPAVEEVRFTAVNRQPDPAPSPTEEPQGYTAVYAPPSAEPVREAVPEPRAAGEAVPDVELATGPRFPYRHGLSVAGLLIEKMPDEAFDEMFPILADHYRSRHGSLD